VYIYIYYFVINTKYSGLDLRLSTGDSDIGHLISLPGKNYINN
jgi:hypothetical protein